MLPRYEKDKLVYLFQDRSITIKFLIKSSNNAQGLFK